MPGVGKTRIAEQIWEDAKTKGKFDKVTMAVVSSGELNVIKLQQDLAGHLNCTFASQDNDDRRASQLKHSIMNGGKVLIILDDVWRKIPLNVIGIQFGEDGSSKGCKILFTSREENVLRSNNCLDPVKITALKDDEAWLMFEESVGTGNIPDEPLAKKVCDKCAGLPLVIRAVGKALEFVSRDSWIDALEQLENCEIESVPGIEPKVYACLKLSFDKLEKDAKLCLLLCSLYPEDAKISISMLIHLATGSQLVEGGRKRVRIRVHAMVAILKSSLLVLENDDDEDFKLHDIIRDVARSIAVKDHAFSFIRCDSELPDSSGTQKLLCLQMDKSDFYIPDNLMYQDIHTFWVESAGFASQFQVLEVASKFVNLRLLVLRNVCGEQQKQSVPLQHLDKLRMIVLQECDIGAIDFNLFPENIETLCIWDCLLPEVPDALNIVNLKHLRKLEILVKYSMPVVLVANTISSLSRLEELHLPNGYIYQEEKVYEIDSHSQLMEISTLSRLTSLLMRFQLGPTEHIQDLEKVFSNLSEFHICVCDLGASINDTSSLTRSIELCGEELQDAFQRLIERAEEVILRCTDVDVSCIFDNNRQAFADLKHLKIDGSGTMEHLAKISHHHHLYQIQPRTSFFKLTRLCVGNCFAMKYLFCNSVAKCLVQLEKLIVYNCPVMEAIVMNEGIVEEEDVRKRGNIEASSSRDKKKQIIEFIHLGKVTLRDLPNLRSFMSGADYECHMPALQDVEIDNCGFSTLFPFFVISSSLQQLREIDIRNCALLEGIVEEEDVRKRGNIEASSSRDKKKKIIEFIQLERVILVGLPNLRSFMSGADYECHMPALANVHIDNCGISTLFPFFVISSLQQLTVIYISKCALLEGIVEEDVRKRGNIEASSSRDNKKKKIIKVLFQLKKVIVASCISS